MEGKESEKKEKPITAYVIGLITEIVVRAAGSELTVSCSQGNQLIACQLKTFSSILQELCCEHIRFTLSPGKGRIFKSGTLVLDSAPVQLSTIVEINTSILRKILERFRQFFPDDSVVLCSRFRCIRRRIQPSEQSLQVKFLFVWKLFSFVFASKKFMQLFRADVLMIYFIIVIGIVSQNRLIPFKKRSVHQAIVPDQGDVAIATKDPFAFVSKLSPIKPVKGLGNSHKIHRTIRKSSLLGSARERSEVSLIGKKFFPCDSHFKIWLNPKYIGEMRYQQLCQDSCPGSYISAGLELRVANGRDKVFYHFDRIRRPKLHIV